MDEIIPKVIISALISLFKDSHAPHVNQIKNKITDIVYRNCLDRLYPDVNFDISKDTIIKSLNAANAMYRTEKGVFNDSEEKIFNNEDLLNIKLLG